MNEWSMNPRNINGSILMFAILVVMDNFSVVLKIELLYRYRHYIYRIIFKLIFQLLY